MTLTGGCLCGHIRWRCDAPPLWQMHCHCQSCRRATGSPFTSYFGVADGTWSFTGGKPAERQSSPGTFRAFCPRCGSPVSYRSARFPGERHFHAAALDDPRLYTPTAHEHWAEHLPWIHLNDGLPRHDTTAP